MIDSAAPATLREAARCESVVECAARHQLAMRQAAFGGEPPGLDQAKNQTAQQHRQLIGERSRLQIAGFRGIDAGGARTGAGGGGARCPLQAGADGPQFIDDHGRGCRAAPIAIRE